MSDLQAAVTAWHIEHWPKCPTAKLLDKAEAELAELRAAAASASRLSEEAADVALVLMALAGRRGFDLFAEMRHKFEINAARSPERVHRDG